MWVNINTDSIGTSIGAIIVLTFTIFFLTSYLFVKKKKLDLVISATMFSLLLYMGGYSIYASSTNVVKVLFWTRICYLGVASVVYTAYLLSSTIMQKYSRKLENFTIIYFIVMVILIFMPNELMFTSVLKSGKTHSSVVKGPLFLYFVVILLIICILLLGRFIRELMKSREKIHIVSPILFGMSIWLVEGAIYGVLGALLSIIQFQISLGPIIMTFCLALYSARTSDLIDQELTMVKEEKDEIYNSLIYDSLSGLFTREYFIEILQQLLAYKNRQRLSSCILFLDIDNFKPVNDELGHNCGDELIKLIGSVMVSHTRKSDVCARYGGDEFMILLNNSSVSEAEKVADKINSDFKNKLSTVLGEWDGQKNISLSTGVLSSKDWHNCAIQTITRADHVMYKAKNSGKNSTVHF